MNELPIAEFQNAIQATHCCESSFRKKVRVHEEFKGQTVWEGEVLVFYLMKHPTAKKCYAWSVDGRVTAVLHEGPVDSPEAAVRAAIAGCAPLPPLWRTASSRGPRLSRVRPPALNSRILAGLRPGTPKIHSAGKATAGSQHPHPKLGHYPCFDNPRPFSRPRASGENVGLKAAGAEAPAVLAPFTD